MSAPTPICDFVRDYAEKRGVRAHMPGHKGKAFLGWEPYDLTEIKGADSLYEASGVIAESQRIASALFGSGATLYSAGGSSQALRAMVMLVCPEGSLILAGRNAHRGFLHACGLLDLRVRWLMPEGERASLCACPITAGGVLHALETGEKPSAVYLTAPDYLGSSPDLRAIAAVCHAHGVPLLVDNAHGAYLRFLPEDSHPMTLGADMCCDSAHKTLPAVTGAAYLHIAEDYLPKLRKSPMEAMAAFGSTSPSYLILQSLDFCNRYLTDGYRARLAAFCDEMTHLKSSLRAQGFHVWDSDPLRLTVFDGAGGLALAEHLRHDSIECEFADRDAVVLMLTPENGPEDLRRIEASFASFKPTPWRDPCEALALPERACSIRTALLAPSESVLISSAAGRVCSCPSVSCPPAVPVVVSGEIITQQACRLMERYGIDTIEVVKE